MIPAASADRTPTKLAHETLHRFVAAGESLIGDQVLPDAHGITASVERVLNDLAIRFRRTRVPTRFEQKYTLRGVHLELGGIKSAEDTHESDLVGETQLWRAPAAGRSRVGRLRESGHREIVRRGRETSGSETGRVLSGTNARLDLTVQ